MLSGLPCIPSSRFRRMAIISASACSSAFTKAGIILDRCHLSGSEAIRESAMGS